MRPKSTAFMPAMKMNSVNLYIKGTFLWKADSRAPLTCFDGKITTQIGIATRAKKKGHAFAYPLGRNVLGPIETRHNVDLSIANLAHHVGGNRTW